MIMSQPFNPFRRANAILPLATLWIASLAITTHPARAAVTEVWIQRYNGSTNGFDEAVAVAMDGSGNVVVTGYSGSGTNSDYYTAKYAARTGALLWEQRHNGTGNGDDYPAVVAVDGSGNVVVTGESHNGISDDYYTARYAPADGVLLWQQRYNGPASRSDFASAVAVDGSGNVVVTGTSGNGEPDYDYYTAKYAAGTGALLWERRYDGPGHGDDYAQAVAVDGIGNVVVTGSSYNGAPYYDIDYYTAKYAAMDGALLWERRYNGPADDYDFASAVAVDSSGNVVVTGSSYNTNGFFRNYDYYTAKYAAADGALLWEKRYNGPKNGYDFASALAVDASGNVVVTGSSEGTNAAPARSPDYNDYYTAKYAAADGALLWETRYSAPAGFGDYASAVAVDSRGNVVVTGTSYNGVDREGDPINGDYYTAKYAAADGALFWEKRYNGPANGDDYVNSSRSLALGPNGVVAVTGSSFGGVSPGSRYDYATVVYQDDLSSDGCNPLGTWVSRVSGTTNALNDVAFANGRFVAVGGNFGITTSPDGVVWTNQFIAGSFPLNGVTFGNNQFVTVGVNGLVRVSANGTAWSSPISTAGADLNGVTWGNGTFVAVGTNGVILTSTNGTAWTVRASGMTNVLRGVTYGNGRFLAVGNSGAVLVSTNNGTNWTSGASDTFSNLADVTFGGGLFVAVGPSGLLFTSVDGLAWAAGASGSGAILTGVTYGGGRFVAVGNNAAANGVLTTSTDGYSWSAYPLPGTVLWSDITFNNGTFVVVGQGGAILQSEQYSYVLGQPQSRSVCATEPVSFTFAVVSGCPLTFQWQLNGTNLPGATSSNLSIAAASVDHAGAYTAVASDGTHTLVSAPATLQVDLCRALDQWTKRAPPPGLDALNGVVCAPDSFVAVGNGGTILRSSDSVNWLASPSGTNAALNAVAHQDGVFVAVGSSGVILTSSNSAGWTLRDSGTNRILRNIAHGRGLFIAVGDQGTVLSSSDAVTWTAQNLGTNRTLLGLTWAGDQFVAVGAGGFLTTSPDGTNWSPHASGVSLTLYDVTCGNGTFVVVGNAGAITTSTNGVDWIRRTSPVGSLLHGVTWANGTFVAVGMGGLVLSSPDGISWAIRNSRTTQNLNDIVYCGNAFVAVGANGTIQFSGYSVAPRLLGRTAGAGFELELTGEIGVNFRVQTSPILPATNWLDWFSFTNSWPVTTLRDTSAANAQQRFYRAVSN
jgi:hypothetical protein